MQRRNGVSTALFVIIAIATIAILSSPSAASTSSQLIDIGNAYSDVGRYQDALNTYDKALEIDPNNSNAWESKGLALKNLGRFQEALDALNRAIELNPDNLEALLHKGYTLIELGKRQEAIAVAYEVINKSERLLAINPNDDQAWHYIGSELSVLEKYNDALNAFNKAISINPNNPHTWFTKGNALFALARYQESLDAYNKATEINPNLAHFWRRKGDALKVLGQYQEANDAYDKAYEVTIAASSSSGTINTNDLFSEGLKYFSVMGIISLFIIGIILSFEKREKNKPEFRDDLKTRHQPGYYSVLAGQFILFVIFIFISYVIAFKELPISFEYNKFIFAIPILYLSLSSFILTIGLSTSKPNTKLNKVHFFISLILGILLFAALGDPKTPVFLPFLPLISAGLSAWYDRFAILKPVSPEELIPKSTTAIPFTHEIGAHKDNSLQKDIIISSVFGYKGATILYKVKIENTISAPIADIKVSLFVPNVFLLLDKEKSLALLKAGESKTVTFEIRPTGECGDCEVSGKVTYYDAGCNRNKEMDIDSKMLSIVCPMLKVKGISESEWHDMVNNLLETEESTKEIDIPAETLFAMVSRIIKDMQMHSLNPEVTPSQQLFNGVARFYGEGVKGLRYAAQIEVVGGTRKSKLILKAWAEKEDALTGFYHGILDKIEKRINIKDYIDEPIVQQYNIHIGDRIGTQIKDSIVQRSTISAGARKCPECGREVDANEKFCMDCGAKLG